MLICDERTCACIPIPEVWAFICFDFFVHAVSLTFFFSWALLKIKVLGIMIACVTINRKVKKTKQRSRKNFRNTSFSIDNYVDVVL